MKRLLKNNLSGLWLVFLVILMTHSCHAEIDRKNEKFNYIDFSIIDAHKYVNSLIKANFPNDDKIESAVRSSVYSRLNILTEYIESTTIHDSDYQDVKGLRVRHQLKFDLIVLLSSAEDAMRGNHAELDQESTLVDRLVLVEKFLKECNERIENVKADE